MMFLSNNPIFQSMISLIIKVELLLASKSLANKLKDSGFKEISLRYNDGLGVQDSSGVNEWSYVTKPDFKRCDFRQIDVLCIINQKESSGQPSICQINCNSRGYYLGLCYSQPGPGAEPSGEWEQSRGAHYCYCSLCHNDKCMAHCQGFGYATGYCHESATYGMTCKCLGCDASFCAKHCNTVFGNGLQLSLCRHNHCKCTAKSC